MLAGKKAFRGDSITALIFKIITEEPPPLREAIADLPEELVRVVGKALAKTPETRHQTGRELAEELLALTRVGSTPTLRQSETPTSPAIAGSPPTVMSAGKGGAATVVSPPTARAAIPAAQVPPPPARRASPPPPPLPVARPTTRKHSSTGLLLGLAAVGLVAVALVGAAGWYLFRSHAPGTVADAGSATAQGSADASASTTQSLASVPTPEPQAQVPSAPENVAPTSIAAAPPTTAPPQPAPAAQRTASNNTRAPGTLAAAPPTRPIASEPVPAEPPPGQHFSFLDQEPPPVDGVEAGRRLSESFRNGRSTGGSFGTNQRLRARDRSPRDLGRGEFPAVATLRHVITCEEVFYRKHARYGTLAELKAEGLLRLDVAVQARQFLRQSYSFDLDLQEDGFRVSALPRGSSLRPFVGDDSGIIRAGTE